MFLNVLFFLYLLVYFLIQIGVFLYFLHNSNKMEISLIFCLLWRLSVVLFLITICFQTKTKHLHFVKYKNRIFEFSLPAPIKLYIKGKYFLLKM